MTDVEPDQDRVDWSGNPTQTPTRQGLIDASCWFGSDQASGPEMTAFKREARWRQHRWAVDELSVDGFGTHPVRRTDPDDAPREVVNGTKLRPFDAAVGANFLNPDIHAVAEARLADKQPHETLDATRLRRDLLSSMPMAFNLFGEASLPSNASSREALAALFGVDRDIESDIVFEWSPERRSDLYTRDRTAFDVALRLGAPHGPRTVIGIETKYHEHSAKEKRPPANKSGAIQRHEDQTAFLVDIAERSGVFAPGWHDRVLTTDLRQIWRDHLLALSMRQHPDRWTGETRYALLYPRRNVSFADAARRYAGVLNEGATSFLALAIEDVVEAAFTHGGPTGEPFRRRYLW